MSCKGGQSSQAPIKGSYRNGNAHITHIRPWTSVSRSTIPQSANMCQQQVHAGEAQRASEYRLRPKTTEASTTSLTQQHGIPEEFENRENQKEPARVRVAWGTKSTTTRPGLLGRSSSTSVDRPFTARNRLGSAAFQKNASTGPRSAASGSQRARAKGQNGMVISPKATLERRRDLNMLRPLAWAITGMPNAEEETGRASVADYKDEEGEQEEEEDEEDYSDISSTISSDAQDEDEEEQVVEAAEEGAPSPADAQDRLLAGDQLRKWLEGSPHDSVDYDTDLEEDFAPEPEIPVDATGKYVYEDECKKQGIVAASFLVRNLGEGVLRMRHHYLGGCGTVPLAEALKRNTVCEEVDLSDNYLEGQGAVALADMLKENMFVVNLNVSNNFIRSQGAEAMSEMLEANTTLKTLSLQGNQLCDTDAKRVAEAMKNNMSLSCLDLSHNKFGEIGGVYLGVGLAANIGLSDFDVSWNSIREKGAVAIAKALQKNASLEILDLSWNGIALTGTATLAQSLKVNKALRVLDISNNRLNTEAGKLLGPAIGKNQGLETLLLGMNPIGEEGMEAILKGVASNTTLKLVGLEGCADISIAPRLKTLIKALNESRDIMIMYSTGSPQQSRINQTILAVFDKFITENADRMEDLFNQMDKGKNGGITLEEFKYGLKDFGLRLTSKQLDMLLDELDADRSGTIEFDELMSGSRMVEQEKQKLARSEREAQLLKESISHFTGNNSGNSNGNSNSSSNVTAAGKTNSAKTKTTPIR